MNKKKKLLFLCGNMNIGGVQKSLLSLLSLLDYEKYEVDLLLIQKGGIFMKYIPKQVNILSAQGMERGDVTNPTRLLGNLCNKPSQTISRLLAGIAFKFNRNMAALLEAKSIDKVEETYDVCIDYCGQHLLYYMVNTIKAKKKITFFHNDYSKWDYYYKLDKKYYHQVDSVLTVSPKCVQAMHKYFPEHQDKITCLENITSKQTIQLYQEGKNPYQEEVDYIFVSVGRVCHDKGNDMAIEAARGLKDRGISFKWYVLGPAETKEKEQYYQELIKQNDVKNQYILLGSTDNPYDYMQYADYIIHPARFEGKPVAIDEAKVLDKIVVATSFSTVHDQLEHEVNAIITEMNAKALEEGICKIMNNKELQEQIHKNLEQEINGNEQELEKFYEIINR